MLSHSSTLSHTVIVSAAMKNVKNTQVSDVAGLLYSPSLSSRGSIAQTRRVVPLIDSIDPKQFSPIGPLRCQVFPTVPASSSQGTKIRRKILTNFLRLAGFL